MDRMHEYEQVSVPAAEKNSEYLLWYELPLEDVQIDTSEHMFSPEVVESRLGISAPLTAVVQAGKSNFFVLDTRNHESYATPYLLVENDTFAHKGIWPGEPLKVGRQHLNDRFKYEDDVSPTHFMLWVNPEDTDVLVIRDKASDGGTFISAHVVRHEKDPEEITTDSLYTVEVGKIFEKMKSYGAAALEAPYGYIMNHPVIGRESKTVAGGVYGSEKSELILVDDGTDIVKHVVDDAVYRTDIFANKEPRSQRQILEFIEKITESTLRYDLEAVERVSAPHYNTYGLIGLSEYIQNGVGVCRHQAVLNALIIENAMKARLLAPGEVGVERNAISKKAGHAWAVYKSAGEEYIIDSSFHYTGKREDAPVQKGWRYIVD